MRELAPDVWQLDGRPANAINVYVIGDVLVDAGTVFDRGRILAQLRERTVSAHALTHAHLDHYGASRAITTALRVPMWCGANDVACVEAGTMIGPFGRAIPAAPSVHVDRALSEDDDVAGFVVLDTPGHSPGHVSYWRESDRTLLCGDVLWGWNPFLMRGGMREPPRLVNPDHEQNRRSARRLAELEPALVCFGHGLPCRDTAAFTAAVSALGR